MKRGFLELPLDRLGNLSPHGRVLSNGHLATLITGAGTGFTRWNGLALTGWNPDRTLDADGSYLYVRDRAEGEVWSAGHQPAGSAADRYTAMSRPGVVRIESRHGDVACTLEVCVLPDADVELRRFRLANEGSSARALDVTSYAEIVLHDPGAHAAHPVFSRLFVQTDWVPDSQVLVARRRPSSPEAGVTWLAHALRASGVTTNAPEHETARRRFVGRGRDRARPQAMDDGARLSGTTGSVLDPVFAIRRSLTLDPGRTVELTWVLSVASSRERALALASSVKDGDAVRTGFERARTHALAELGRLGIDAERSALLDDTATALLQGYGRAPGLVSHSGVDSTDPIVDVATIRSHWATRGLRVDGDDEAIRRVTTQLEAQAMEAAARKGRARVRARPRPHHRVRPPRPAPAGRARSASTSPAEPLLFDNGFGGFSAAGDEYRIRVEPSAAENRGLPPLPWVNVIANPRFGFLASESGAGYTWSRNSREYRITPWANDPVLDPHGEAYYVRDEANGAVESPCPGPVPSDAPCEVRHGFGYSTWTRRIHGLASELTMFVARDASVKLVRWSLENPGSEPRRFTLWSYAQFVLGVLPAETSHHLITEQDPASAAILARNPASADFADGIAFATVVCESAAGAVSFSADRTDFLGRLGSVAEPAALIRGTELDGAVGVGLDPCAAFRVPVAIAAGETVECTFLLGEETSLDAVRASILRFRTRGAATAALEDVRGWWRELLSGVRVNTPSPELDLMLNGWLGYQTLSCRIWGRSAFYQSGGAFGFRDQLQDSAGLLHHAPALTRAQILLHAAHQFPEGDVLHWWHPPADRGTRTRFSDDLVWLPYVTAHYVRTTGDDAILDERAPFVTARLLAPGEDETYLQASTAREDASLFEHCCRVLDRSLTHGVHGLPLMGTGDWNDGMNRVGREGRGESVWLAFFLVHVIDEFAPLCEARGESERATRYRSYQGELRAAIEKEAWDGAWYRRAYYDDGSPLGSAVNDECKIDALAQAWAIIAGVAPAERAASALDAVERELILDQPGMIRLLTPPFDKTAAEPGYIKGYLPGIRENGGQYTHAALWVVRALAEFGRRDRAADLFAKLTPVHHARDRAAAAVYQIEPYVVAADIYGVEPHLGRGGWSWYTGSSGWMIRVGLESILGLAVDGGRALVLTPRIPDSWPGYGLEWRAPGGASHYAIEVVNPTGRAEQVIAVEVDGVALAPASGAARVPIAHDGARHQVRITLGRAG